MNCLSPFAALLPLLVAAQPVPSVQGVYSAQETPAELVVGPEQVGAAAFNAADLMARNSLVGVWQGTYFEHNGESFPAIASGLQMKFSRGRLELIQGGRPPLVVAYNINPAKTPSGFLWKVPGSATVTFQDGIYSQEGNTLVICLAEINAPAATQFLTQPADGKTLFVLQRTSP